MFDNSSCLLVRWSLPILLMLMERNPAAVDPKGVDLFFFVTPRRYHVVLTSSLPCLKETMVRIPLFDTTWLFFRIGVPQYSCRAFAEQAFF